MLVVIPRVVSRSANVVPLLLNVSFNFRGKFAYQEPYFQLPFDAYRKDKFRPKYYTSYREFTCAPILYTIHDVYMCIFVISIFFFFFFWIIEIASAPNHRVFIADMPRANWISEMCIRNERRLRNSVNEEWRR